MSHAVEVEPNEETLQHEVELLVNDCPSEIKTDEDFAVAQGWLVSVTTRRKEVEAEFKDPLQKAKAAVKSLQDTVKRILSPLATKETWLRGAVSTYQQKKLAEQRKAQEKLNAQYQKKVERAAEKGKDVTAIAPPPLAVGPAKTTKLEGGAGVTFRTVKKLVVFDESKVPDQYWERKRNDKMIEAALKAGIDVPGAMLKEEQEVAVRG